MDSTQKLYLFNGETYIVVPESAWLDELKSNPLGPTAIHALEDPLIQKGWTKLLGVQNPNNHAYTSEWFFAETGTHLRVLVDEQGQLTVDGAPVGSTTTGEAVKTLQKISEEKTGKWITAVQEVKDANGTPIVVKRKIFIPTDKLRKPQIFAPGKDARLPEHITRIGAEKGGPHPTMDVMTSQKMDAMNQLLGIYTPILLKEQPSPQEMLRRCSCMLEMAEKEENEEERQRLCETIERELAALEAMQKSLKPSQLKPFVGDEAKDRDKYRKLADQTDDPKEKKTLTEISRQEGEHNEKIRQMIARSHEQ